MNVSLHMQYQGEIAPMEAILRNDTLKGLPDTVGFAQEDTLFGGYEEGGNISINIQSDDNGAMRAARAQGIRTCFSAQFPDAAIRTEPALDYDEPQLELIPDDRAIAEAGWTRVDLSNILQSLGEGLYMGQRFDDGEQLYLILKSKALSSQSDLEKHAPRYAGRECRLFSETWCAWSAHWIPAASTRWADFRHIR